MLSTYFSNCVIVVSLLNYKSHVLTAEEEDTTVKHNSKNTRRRDRRKALQKWREGIEVIFILHNDFIYC